MYVKMVGGKLKPSKWGEYEKWYSDNVEPATKHQKGVCQPATAKEAQRTWMKACPSPSGKPGMTWKTTIEVRNARSIPGRWSPFTPGSTG